MVKPLSALFSRQCVVQVRFSWFCLAGLASSGAQTPDKTASISGTVVDPDWRSDHPPESR